MKINLVRLVKIINCFNKDWWHQEYIGKTVEVIDWSHDAYFVKNISEHGGVIPKGDCIMIDNDLVCKCGNVHCIGYVLLHEKELVGLKDRKAAIKEEHGDVSFQIRTSPSSGEIFTTFYELHIRKTEKICENCMWQYPCKGEDLDGIKCSIKLKPVAKKDSCDRFVEEER